MENKNSMPRTRVQCSAVPENRHYRSNWVGSRRPFDRSCAGLWTAKVQSSLHFSSEKDTQVTASNNRCQ